MSCTKINSLCGTQRTYKYFQRQHLYYDRGRHLLGARHQDHPQDYRDAKPHNGTAKQAERVLEGQGRLAAQTAGINHEGEEDDARRKTADD